MYFNDCTRVSSTSAVKSQPTHSLPFFCRLMLCTVNHSYFKNKNYNKNVGKWSVSLQPGDIPSPSTDIYEDLGRKQSLRRHGLGAGLPLQNEATSSRSPLHSQWWHEQIATWTRRDRDPVAPNHGQVWQLNDGAGRHPSQHSSPQSCQDLDPQTTCSWTCEDPVMAQRTIPRGMFPNLHME